MWLAFWSALFDSPINGIPAGHHIVHAHPWLVVRYFTTSTPFIIPSGSATSHTPLLTPILCRPEYVVK